MGKDRVTLVSILHVAGKFVMKQIPSLLIDINIKIFCQIRKSYTISSLTSTGDIDLHGNCFFLLMSRLKSDFALLGSKSKLQKLTFLDPTLAMYS